MTSVSATITGFGRVRVTESGDKYQSVYVSTKKYPRLRAGIFAADVERFKAEYGECPKVGLKVNVIEESIEEIPEDGDHRAYVRGNLVLGDYGFML